MHSDPANPSTAKAARFDESPLWSLAAATRRWMRLAGLGRILLWLALATCAAIALDLTTSLPPGVRAVAGIAILVIAAVLAVIHFISRPARSTVESATRQVEAAHPEIGQMLRTAREASHSSAADSPVLKNELFRRASVRLAGMDTRKLLPKRPAGKWLAAGALALAGFSFFLTTNSEAPVAFARLVSPFSAITYTTVRNTTPDPVFDRDHLPRVEALVTGRAAPNVIVRITKPGEPDADFAMDAMGGGRYQATLPASESSFDYHILAGDSVPATGTMECVNPAEFVASSAEVALPDYTGQAPVRQESADINAVEGTRATLHFTMSAPMASASLKLPDGTLVPLTVDGADLSTTLAIRIGGDSAELTGTDALGHEMLPTRFTHKGFPDAPPVIEWIEPTKDIEATAVAEIPLRLRIKDDFGISSYGVVLQAAGEDKEILTRTVEARDLRDLSELTAAALEAFPLTIRDNVRVFAWAKDYKPRGEAKSVSPLRGVDIKPFKRKWQMVVAASGPPIPQEDVQKVDDLVKTQREILSDAFPLTQGTAATEEILSALGGREAKLQQDAAELHLQVEEEGAWPADDIHLLAAAVSQMGESSAAWYAVEAQPGFDRGDAALSTLLELRKNLLTLLMRADCPCLEPKPEEVPNALTDLAQEAERLAREERDVAQQLVAIPDTERLEAIHRQQDVANADTGELHARLMDHPEVTPLILSHMADAEKQVRESTTRTRSADAVSSAPPQLAIAADTLDSVAKHLRALDEANMDQTLAEMADEAKKAADAAKPEEKKEKPTEQAGEKPGEKPADKPAGEKPGDKPGEKPGAGEKPALAAGDKPGEGAGEKPGEGEGKSGQAGQGKGQGKGKGQGQGKSSGEGQGDEESALAGNGDAKAKQPGDSSGGDDPDAATMASGTGGKAGENPDQGPAATPGKPTDPEAERKAALAQAARQAATHDDILKFFAERESESGKDSRFDALRKETGSDQLEQKLNDVAAGKADGGKTAEQLQEFAAALEQERELRRQSRLENLAKAREQAAELKQQAGAKRDAARKAVQEIAKANSGGFSFDIPKKAEPADEPKPGQGGEGPPGNGPGQTKQASVQDLAKAIDALKDPELSRIAKELETAAPDASGYQPISAAERRLAEMIAEISGLARGDSGDANVPAAYRRAVEDYYRALSDDFGDETPVTR